MILRLPAWRNRMSYFKSFGWDGGEVTLHPTGMRGHKLLKWARMLPYPSGMEVKLRAVVSIQADYKPRDDEQIRIELFRDGTPGSIAVDTLVTGGTPKKELNFGQLAYNGTYRLYAYRRLGDGSAAAELSRGGFAAIHIVPNYYAWVLLWNPVVPAAVAAAIAAILSRLLWPASE